MGIAVLGFVVVFALSTVRGYTVNDLEDKLTDIENYLKRDLYQQALLENTKVVEQFIVKATSSVSDECIYENAQWYLQVYFDPLMASFIDTESVAVKALRDQIGDADYTDQAAVSALYQKIVDLKPVVEEHFARWTSYLRATEEIRDEEFRKCADQQVKNVKCI